MAVVLDCDTCLGRWHKLIVGPIDSMHLNLSGQKLQLLLNLLPFSIDLDWPAWQLVYVANFYSLLLVKYKIFLNFMVSGMVFDGFVFSMQKQGSGAQSEL